MSLLNREQRFAMLKFRDLGGTLYWWTWLVAIVCASLAAEGQALHWLVGFMFAVEVALAALMALLWLSLCVELEHRCIAGEQT